MSYLHKHKKILILDSKQHMDTKYHNMSKAGQKREEEKEKKHITAKQLLILQWI